MIATRKLYCSVAGILWLSGGMYSLEDLQLREGDTMEIVYDFGHRHSFTLEIERCTEEERVLPEADLGYKNQTRARLHSKGNGSIVPRYPGI